jgi:hypothetical protein
VVVVADTKGLRVEFRKAARAFLGDLEIRMENRHMQRIGLSFSRFSWVGVVKVSAAVVLLSGCLAMGAAGQQRGQKTFASAEEASKALVAAAEKNDEKAMLEILGPEGKEIVSSGDETEDKESHANFARRYEQMHRLVTEPDGMVTLYIGAENWPAPIPLVNKGKGWYFATEAGKMEVLYRRVGRNEMSAMHVCREMVAAEKEYYAEQHNEYAQKIFSDEGQHNGLYWKAGDGEPQSPIGPLVAAAVAEGYTKSQNGAPTPYRGYYFHILTGQGKNAPGGAKSFVVNGKMTEGFAFVAYPAEYRSSGVMTFVVGADGVVYEKDLGRKTEVLAKGLKEYNLDSGWRKAETLSEETTSETKNN